MNEQRWQKRPFSATSMVATTLHRSSAVWRAILARHIRRSRRLALSALTPPTILEETYLRSRAPYMIVRVE
jgi:hypothetical protein